MDNDTEESGRQDGMPSRTDQPPGDFAQVDVPYYLLTRLEVWRDGQGRQFIDQLWRKDLALHTRYIPDLTLVAPVREGVPPEGSEPLPEGVKVFALPPNLGWPRTLGNVLPNYVRMRRLARERGVIHTSGAGWPFPMSFYMPFVRRGPRTHWLSVVESADWRSAGGASTIKGRIFERHFRRVMRSVDIGVYTHPGYRDAYPTDGAPSLVNPASWINEADVVSEAALAARQSDRSGAVRALLAGRLLAQKGVDLLLNALEDYPRDAPALEVTIVGNGPLKDACRAAGERFAADRTSNVILRVMEPVPYGPAFWSLVDRTDVMLVPSLGSEQPRIAFDAAARGVPCLASRTRGNEVVVSEGRGFVFEPGDAGDLRARLAVLADDRAALMRAGRAARSWVAPRTHEAMHRTRSHFIARTLTEFSHRGDADCQPPY